MSGVVERLRSEWPGMKDAVDGANEIERLRAENEKLRAKCETIYDELLEAKGQVVKLRAALKLCVCRPNEIAAALKETGDE